MNFNLRLVVCIFFILSSISAYAQLKSYQFEEIDSLQKQNAKPVFVFVSTNWCSYCNAMKSVVFKDKKIIKLLNQNFYFIWLNAEEERTINFNQQQFYYKPTGYKTGIHQLAIELGTVNKNLAYPTICILNSKSKIIYQKQDFTNAKKLEAILIGIAAKHTN